MRHIPSLLVSIVLHKHAREIFLFLKKKTDQGQGAGQAIEDAAALGTVLPKGTHPSDVPERLQLYEKIRYERAHVIQEYSRQAGRDWVNGKPQIDSEQPPPPTPEQAHS